MEKEITKRRVTMRSAVMAPDGMVHTHEAVDYVRPDFLDAFVQDAKRRWQYVEVSEEPDAGPAGWDGATSIPKGVDVHLPDGSTDYHEFPHPLAGTYYPATDCTDCTHAPEGARLVQEN